MAKTPTVITADLNEWVRTDRPGRYSLVVTSNRVSVKPRDQRGIGGTPLSGPLASNKLEFEILPADPVWSRQSLHQAVETLDSVSATNQQKKGAARALRFLDTWEAAIELVHRLPPQDNFLYWEFRLGLLGTPLRFEVIDEMKRMLTAPDAPISSDFVEILATLDVYRTHSPTVSGTPGEAAASQKVRAAGYARTMEQYTEMLGAALVSKTSQARPASLGAVLMLAKQFQGPSSGWFGGYVASPAQQSLMTAIIKLAARSLPSQFLSVSRRDQESLLGNHWTDMAGPEMLPVLEQLIAKSEATNQPGFQDLVLLRLYQLDPEQGREIILKEISKPSGKFSIKSLGLLPDQELPALDDAMAARLESPADAGSVGLGITAQLVQRYGSAAMLPQVTAAYEDKRVGQTTVVTTALLAYFLRVDPNLGIGFIREGLAAGFDRNADFMRAIADTYMCPELEALAMEALADPNATIVGDAIDVLRKYGSPAAEAPLMHAFEQWHDQWKGSEQEIRSLTSVISPGYAKDPVSAQPYFEQAFRGALSAGTGWLSNDQMIDKLESLCLTDTGKAQLETVRSRMKERMILLWWSSTDPGDISASLGQYDSLSLSALKSKLSEFPKGTVFAWDPSMVADQTRPVFADLKTYLESIGMNLVARAQ